MNSDDSLHLKAPFSLTTSLSQPNKALRAKPLNPLNPLNKPLKVSNSIQNLQICHPPQEAQIKALQAQIRTFEEAIQAAIENEKQLNLQMAQAVCSIESLITRQKSEDCRLTELVEQDTQRSREAIADYYHLASTFREKSQTPHRNRLRDAFRTIGIVLSFILIAPIQAVLWLLTQLFATLQSRAWMNSVRNRLKAIFAMAKSSASMFKSAERSNYARISGRRRSRSPAHKSDRRDGLGDSATERQLPSQTYDEGAEANKNHKRLDMATDRTGQRPRTRNVHDSDTGEATWNSIERRASWDSGRRWTQREDTTSCSSEVFVEAQSNIIRGGSGEDELSDGDEGIETQERMGDGTRPGWALPEQGSASFMDFTNFPLLDLDSLSDSEMELGNE